MPLDSAQWPFRCNPRLSDRKKTLESSEHDLEVHAREGNGNYFFSPGSTETGGIHSSTQYYLPMTAGNGGELASIILWELLYFGIPEGARFLPSGA